jgi:hypothetical protein
VALDERGVVHRSGLAVEALAHPAALSAATAGVLELPSGTLDASGTALGHRIVFAREKGQELCPVRLQAVCSGAANGRPSRRLCLHPLTIAETGLHPDSLSQLLLKTLVGGEISGTSLADKLRLPYSVLEELIQHARVEKLIEVRGATASARPATATS